MSYVEENKISLEAPPSKKRQEVPKKNKIDISRNIELNNPRKIPIPVQDGKSIEEGKFDYDISFLEIDEKHPAENIFEAKIR